MTKAAIHRYTFSKVIIFSTCDLGGERDSTHLALSLSVGAHRIQLSSSRIKVQTFTKIFSSSVDWKLVTLKNGAKKKSRLKGVCHTDYRHRYFFPVIQTSLGPW